MECNFVNCGVAAVAKGLCMAHYQQQRRGVQLKPLRQICSEEGCRNTVAANGLCKSHTPTEIRVCTVPWCDTVTARSVFCRPHQSTFGRHNVGAKMLKKKFSTRSCAICNTDSSRLHIDHDHACCPGAYSCGQCVRGYLCINCNFKLGKHENVDNHKKWLENALAYLANV